MYPVFLTHSLQALLDEKYSKGQITLKTKWRDFLKSIKDDERYKAMVSPNQLG